jgi:hypothetical protein
MDGDRVDWAFSESITFRYETLQISSSDRSNRTADDISSDL